MIYIIRHGQTEMNQANVLQGRSNFPLNEKGTAQAESAAKRLKDQKIVFDKMYSSPLIRAVQTAKIVGGELLPLVVDERLIEMDYGPYEGMDLKKPAPEVLHFFSDFQNNPAPEGMEPLDEVVKRSGEFLEEIKEEAEKYTILISTHAIAMKGLLEYLTPDSNGAYWSKYIGNCEVYSAEVKDGAYTVPTQFLTDVEGHM